MEHSLVKKYKSSIYKYANNGGQFIVFHVGESLYAVDIFHTKGIVQSTEINSIPNVPKNIVGVSKIRGRSIPIMNLMIKFNQNFDPENLKFVLMVENSGYWLGLLLEDLPKTMYFNADQLETISFVEEITIERTYIQGIIKSKDENHTNTSSVPKKDTNTGGMMVQT